MKIVNMGRSIQADRNHDVVGLEAIHPALVDQNAIGSHRNGYLAAGSRRYVLASLGHSMKILGSPQQWFTAVQSQGEFSQGIFDDMLLDTPQQLPPYVGVHQLGFGINRGV